MTRLAKLSSKNQLTVPKAVLESYPDVQYFDVSVAEGGILLKPVREQSADSVLASVRAHFKRLGLGPEDVRDAVRWSRDQKRRR